MATGWRFPWQRGALETLPQDYQSAVTHGGLGGSESRRSNCKCEAYQGICSFCKSTTPAPSRQLERASQNAPTPPFTPGRHEAPVNTPPRAPTPKHRRSPPRFAPARSEIPSVISPRAHGQYKRPRVRDFGVYGLRASCHNCEDTFFVKSERQYEREGPYCSVDCMTTHTMFAPGHVVRAKQVLVLVDNGKQREGKVTKVALKVATDWEAKIAEAALIAQEALDDQQRDGSKVQSEAEAGTEAKADERGEPIAETDVPSSAETDEGRHSDMEVINPSQTMHESVVRTRLRRSSSSSSTSSVGSSSGLSIRPSGLTLALGVRAAALKNAGGSERPSSAEVIDE
eukprot:CAMPEP_0119482648 /NCGR_PEP_ID=MMETSP1344-20130328/10407_1 /TAXON_ID=236787 /ORGANISM="Florenciella parvula, Strain CCMP2471" /LENGTH=341 /DNA_ID=CAMNT_0007517071 /DNA_START=47 /DNA_END=1073 /DNA_ORIENTATION=+